MDIWLDLNNWKNCHAYMICFNRLRINMYQQMTVLLGAVTAIKSSI